MSTEKYPWPQWQLTAFVLNELEPDVAAQIQSAADGDPSLAAEIGAIRATVAQVTQLYKHETTGIERTAFAAPSNGLGDSVSTSANDPVVFRHKRYLKMNRTAAVGLLAMAASLLIAVFLAAPALNKYFAKPTTDVLAKGPKTVSLSTAAPEQASARELAALSKKSSTRSSAVKDQEAEVDSHPFQLSIK